jgi:hypothetical protein
LKTRIPLAPGVGEPEIDSLARQLGWELGLTIPATRDHPFEKVWLTAGDRTAVHYIEDFLLKIAYLQIESADSAAAEQAIRAVIHAPTRDTIKDILREATTRDEKIDAIYRLALLAPGQFDDAMFRLFESSMGDADPEVRRAAVFGTAYVAWREFRQPLERLAKSDPDPAVRDFAGEMLASHDRHQWKRPLDDS